MKRKVLYGFIGGLVLLVLGFLVGLITGTDIGGNYLTEFEFAGVRGYEAVGLLGGIIGAAFGAVLGTWLGILLADRRKNGGI